MSVLQCPHCNTGMYKVVEPEISTDVCPNCKGVWLEKGEINILASGMAGNIEYCSIDDKTHVDRFPVRRCPKCPDQNLKKSTYLAIQKSSLIFAQTAMVSSLMKGKSMT